MLIYNTRTRRKEEFVPISQGKVTMYACGPTVYNFFHIGNGRTFIAFDLLRRYLRYKGYDTTMVQNFTDIDDKMINSARANGISVKELGDRFIEEYWKDAKALGIEPADMHPRATEHMQDIIDLIGRLIDSGIAYQASDGVYFDTRKFQNYGSLSGQDLDALQSGARVDVDEEKRDPLDFALWKAQKPDEPSWDSPFGPGRPGWHIECSAMSMHYLGETMDIHAGGQDLVFPHHENELAQSSAATGKPLANYWVHTGFLNIDEQKMSKSLGNFFTVRDIAQMYDLGVVRYFLLSAHYRSPLNFSKEMVEQAAASLARLTTARQNWDFLVKNGEDTALDDAQVKTLEGLNAYRERFIAAMDDDLNTAQALGVLFDLVREGNTQLAANNPPKALAQGYLQMLNELAAILNLFYADEDVQDGEVQKLVEQRDEARREKNWALSDEIRNKLTAMGYQVEDTAQGTRVIKK